MNTLWLVNGRSTGVDPADRGLAYGDGLFETMALHDGRIRWFDLHLDRLEEGCRQLEIPPPSRALLAAEIEANRPGEASAVVKVIITRGSGARGYSPPDPASPTRVLSISPWPTYPDSYYLSGIHVAVCRMRLGENPALAGIKHLCRLEQVLAQLELRGQPVQQGLLLDTRGNVIGGTSSNVFAVLGATLVTPTLTRCGIRGVMRRAVLDSARAQQIAVEERDLTLPELLGADELFMTNSLFGIWPVADVDGKRFGIGSTTQHLAAVLGYERAA